MLRNHKIGGNIRLFLDKVLLYNHIFYVDVFWTTGLLIFAHKYKDNFKDLNKYLHFNLIKNKIKSCRNYCSCHTSKKKKTFIPLGAKLLILFSHKKKSKRKWHPHIRSVSITSSYIISFISHDKTYTILLIHIENTSIAPTSIV